MKTINQTLIHFRPMFTAGLVWLTYSFRRYQHRIQLDVDANLYKLGQPVCIKPFARYSRKEMNDEEAVAHTHAIEVLLKFTNKGKTRFKLYNAQIGINTLLRPRFDEDDGHLHLNRIFTSGNIVPELPEPGKPIEESSFYCLEPNVEQSVHYLALTPEPKELVQVVANFDFQQRRVSVEDMKRGLYPHSAVRTFQITKDGTLIRSHLAS